VYPHQLDRLTGVLERGGLDALVGSTPADVAYVTGFRSLSQAVYPSTLLFAVFSRRGTALVVPSIDAAAVAAGRVEVDHVTCYGEFFSEDAGAGEAGRRVRSLLAEAAPTPAEALAAALDALGVRAGTVALDDESLGARPLGALTERLAARAVTGARAHLAAARMVKSPYEIECLERALRIAEEAVNVVVQMLKPGVSEREAVVLYEAEVQKRGAVPYCSIIATGERSALPAAYAADVAVRPGDLVRFDLGCVFKGYYSDVARTAVVGEPSKRQEAIHAALQAGEEAAIGAIRPGARGRAVFDTAVAAVREAGLAGYRRHHVGHGIGLEPAEPPTLAPGGDHALESGMVLRVEAPYYEHGWGGLNVKDTVLVTRDGAHVLNRSHRGLVVLD
jgi:Xaa-Pro aminopeptidase